MPSVRENFSSLLVADAFKQSRAGNLTALATSALATTSLVEDTFQAHERVRLDARGRTLQSVLRSAVARLRPSGAESWVELPWRTYNILFHFYLAVQRAADLAELMAISEQPFYQARTQAIQAAHRFCGRSSWSLPIDWGVNATSFPIATIPPGILEQSI